MRYSNLLLLLVVSAVALATPMSGGEDEAYCQATRKTYNVEPGRSFGTLPVSMHKRYLAARCYRYFCEPNELAGKGVFDCVPLKSSQK
jgi:hypothetical protein